jgi:hypothetical protein
VPLIIFILIIWFLGPVFLGLGFLIAGLILSMAILLLIVDFTNGCLCLKASEERREDAAVALGAWTFVGWLVAADFLGDPIISGATPLASTGIGAAIGFIHALLLLAFRRRSKSSRAVLFGSRRTLPPRDFQGRFRKADLGGD